MKKSFKTLALGLVTVGMLAACGPKPAPNWSSDDQKTMSDNLYGVVLPYLSLANPEVKFDPANEQVVVTGDELESTAIASYAQKFTVSEGWTDTTPANAAYYSFEKQVNNEAGAKRWVGVQFGNEEYDPEPAPSGNSLVQSEGEAAAKAKRFAMYAADPYSYEFPLEDIQARIKRMCGIENANIPVFQSERYLARYYQSGGKTYLYDVFCYADSTCEASYKAQFESAQYGHVVVANKDGGYDAYARTQNYVIHFEYVASEGGMYVEVNNFEGWPNLAIEDYFKQLLPSGAKDVAALPAYEQGFEAVFAEYSASKKEVTAEVIYSIAEGSDYDIDSFRAAEANYVTTLKKTFHEGTVAGEKILFSPNDEFAVTFRDYTSSDYYDRFIIVAQPAPELDDVAWPAAKIEAYFAANNLAKQGLPACEIAASSFRFEKFEAGESGDARCAITLYNAITETVTDFNAYATALQGDGYIPQSGATATSAEFLPAGKPDHKVRLTISDKNIKVIVFLLDVSTDFPMAKVLSEFGIEAAQSPYPTFTVENADYFEFSVMYEGEQVLITANFVDEEKATAGKAAIYNAFAAATETWLEASANTFTSLNGDFKVRLIAKDAKSFYVLFNQVMYVNEFPSSRFIQGRLIGGYDEMFDFLFPAPTGFTSTKWGVQTLSYSGGHTGVKISATFADADTATANANSYIAQLIGVGYQNKLSSGYLYGYGVYMYPELDGTTVSFEFYL